MKKREEKIKAIIKILRRWQIRIDDEASLEKWANHIMDAIEEVK